MMKAVEGHNSKMVVLVEYTTVVMEHHYFRIFFYIILFSVTSINCWSQNFTNYYNDRNEAIHNYYEGKLEKADSLLTVAFKKVKPLGKDVYFAAVVSAKMKNIQKTRDLLKFSCVLNGISLKWLKEDSAIFSNVFTNFEFNRLLDTIVITTNLNYYLYENSKFNTMNYNFFDSLLFMDQKYRSDFKDSTNITEEQKLKLMKVNDDIVQKKLMDYVEEYGWPDYSELLTTILIHFSEENYLKYKTILLREVKIGHLDPFWYARMCDRLEKILYNNDCTYGIWTKSKCGKDIIRTNRLQIGLSLYYEGPFRTFKLVKK
ncbi:MAG: hypothetical protein KBD43_08335 [Saprospiraceae bacterium]|nr:hypothetical protein [Saprospiraceae bacterium]